MTSLLELSMLFKSKIYFYKKKTKIKEKKTTQFSKFEWSIYSLIFINNQTSVKKKEQEN